MKLSSFISTLHKLNADLVEFPPDLEGQETTLLPGDEIVDVIYHSMLTMWKNKMFDQGFNYVDSTDLFETRVENLEPKGYKKS